MISINRKKRVVAAVTYLVYMALMLVMFALYMYSHIKADAQDISLTASITMIFSGIWIFLGVVFSLLILTGKGKKLSSIVLLLMSVLVLITSGWESCLKVYASAPNTFDIIGDCIFAAAFLLMSMKEFGLLDKLEGKCWTPVKKYAPTFLLAMSALIKVVGTYVYMLIESERFSLLSHDPQIYMYWAFATNSFDRLLFGEFYRFFPFVVILNLIFIYTYSTSE